jgi:ubiquitin-protein ligase E3 C
MEPSEQEAFLKFVTACSRPPLLGFKYLEPQLCVQVGFSSMTRMPAGKELFGH